MVGALQLSRKLAASGDPLAVQKVFLDFLEGHWEQPDEGLWEVRGGRRHFTHSKVMAWMDNYALQGRQNDACRLFEQLLSLRNDLGLLAEEYDTQRRRLVGNFPQAFSHVALVNTAHNLAGAFGPAQQRSAA